MEVQHTPSIFISYSHDSPAHAEWVKGFAENLGRTIGWEIILDDWSYDRSLPWNAFMVESIWRSDAVLLVCTEEYRAKAENLRGQSGVSRESIITLTDFYSNPQKFIPVVREVARDGSPVVPYWMKDWDYIDFSPGSDGQRAFEKLYRDLRRLSSSSDNSVSLNPASRAEPKSLDDLVARIRNTQASIAEEFLNNFHLGDGRGSGAYPYVNPYIEVSKGDTRRLDLAHLMIQDFADSSSDNVFLLLGEYGSGKTSLCEFMITSQAEHTDKLLIAVSCRAYPECEPDDLSKWLNDVLHAVHRIGHSGYSWGMRFDELERINERFGLILWIDGLDELTLSPAWTPESMLTSLVRQARTFPWKTVLTSRDVYLGALDKHAMPMRRSAYADNRQLNRLWSEAKLRIGFIQAFDDVQIDEYFSGASSGGYNIERARLPINIAGFARRPIFAQFLADSPELIDVEDLRVVDLYEDMIAKSPLTSRKSKLLDARSSTEALEEIAFAMFVANRREVNVQFIEQCIERCMPAGNSQAIAAELLAKSVLVVLPDRRVGFSHNTIMEYFVATRLCKKLAVFENSELYVRLLTEPINEFMVELLAKIDEGIPYLESSHEFAAEMVLINVSKEMSAVLEVEDGYLLISKNAVTCGQYEIFLKANPGMLPPRSEGRELLYQLGTRANVDWFVQDVETYLSLCERLCWDRGERNPPAGAENEPVVYVSWFDAWAFCRWSGVRLPTYGEWVLAGHWDAAIDDFQVYPLSGAPIVSWNCNCSGIIGGPVSVDEMPNAVSPCNCRHMLGNVAEWTGTWSNNHKVYMFISGGGWSTGIESGALGNPGVSFPNVRRNFVGFRVVKDLLACFSARRQGSACDTGRHWSGLMRSSLFVLAGVGGWVTPTCPRFRPGS